MRSISRQWSPEILTGDCVPDNVACNRPPRPVTGIALPFHLTEQVCITIPV
jgi:hypothetical protein